MSNDILGFYEMDEQNLTTAVRDVKLKIGKLSPIFSIFNIL